MYDFFLSYQSVSESQENGFGNRSVSFSGGSVVKKPARGPGPLTRVESDTTNVRLSGYAQSPTIDEGIEMTSSEDGGNAGGALFASKLAMIQSQLQEKIGEKQPMSDRPVANGTVSR